MKFTINAVFRTEIADFIQDKPESFRRSGYIINIKKEADQICFSSLSDIQQRISGVSQDH